MITNKFKLAERYMLLAGVSTSLKIWRYTLYSAMLKIYMRNAGSKLGLIWESLSTVLVSSILALVWIKVLEVEESWQSYFIYVYFGMVVWGGLSTAVSNLCATLIKNCKNITSRTLPIFSYIFEDILLSYIPMIMSLPFVATVMLASGSLPTINGLVWFIFGILLVLLASFGFALSVGLASFFIGDIKQIISSIMRLSFLITPVIWKPERLGDAEYFLLLNPFYGYLHILRNGLSGQPIELQYALQALIVTGVLIISGILMYEKLKAKIQARAMVF